jgi:type II secretory pathway component PulF
MRVELEVVSGRGVPHALRLEAVSIEDASAQAARLGYAVLSTRTAPSIRLSWHNAAAVGSAKLDVVVFVEHLRDLLGAGLSVIESLEALRRGSSGTEHCRKTTSDRGARGCETVPAG